MSFQPRNVNCWKRLDLTADLWLCGTVIVDAGETGICLFLFSGECLDGEHEPSPEETAEWIAYDAIPELPVVEDLPVLLAKIHHMQRGDQPFLPGRIMMKGRS